MLRTATASSTKGRPGRRLITVPRGVDLPIAGEPDQSRVDDKPTARVGLLGDDYVGMKPTMLVAEGDRVKAGQPVFRDKKTEGVLFTAPAAGVVAEINRGAKRKFLSLVIDRDGEDAQEFPAHSGDFGALTRGDVRDGLVNAGLWPAFRRRPFGKTPELRESPHSIFVTAIDTNPLAPDPVKVIAEKPEFFGYGLQLLPHLTGGAVYLCTAPGANLPGRRPAEDRRAGVRRPAPRRAGRHAHPRPRPGQPAQGGLARRLPGRDRVRGAVRHRPGPDPAGRLAGRPAGQEPPAGPHGRGGGPVGVGRGRR